MKPSKKTVFLFFFLILILNLYAERRKLSPQILALSSLVIPGSGQLLAQEKRGEIFIYSDAVMLMFYGFHIYLGNTLNHNAKIFAVLNADANIKRDERYFRELERYSSNEEYNQDVLRYARRLYPDDPDKQKEYLAKNGYFNNDAWQWKDDSARIKYWQARNNARSKYLTASFFFAGSIILRIASAIDCLIFLPERKFSYQIDFLNKENGLACQIGIKYRF